MSWMDDMTHQWPTVEPPPIKWGGKFQWSHFDIKLPYADVTCPKCDNKNTVLLDGMTKDDGVKYHGRVFWVKYSGQVFWVYCPLCGESGRPRDTVDEARTAFLEEETHNAWRV